MSRTKSLTGIILALVAVVAVVAMAQGRRASHSQHVKVRTAGVSASDHFAVFRRAATRSDRLRRMSGHRARTSRAVGGASRLVLVRGTVKIYALDPGDGQLCLVYRDASVGLGSTTCTSTEQAARGELPPELTMVGPKETYAYMLLPDGVASIEATDEDGRKTDVSVSSNAVVLPAGAEAAMWATADGQIHRLGNLAPDAPLAARPAG
jgi:hypothetical protein